MRTASRSVERETAVTDSINKMDPIFHLSQTIWSSTKNLTALAMACLVDRGLLSYSDKLLHYYSTNDKICMSTVLF